MGTGPTRLLVTNFAYGKAAAAKMGTGPTSFRGQAPLGRAGLYVAKFAALLRKSYGVVDAFAAYHVLLDGGDWNELSCETPT